MDKKYLANVFLFLVTGLAAICVILYALYHLGSWGEASYSTSTAVRIDAEVGFSATGYVFRSETPLSGSVEGAFYCPAGDGSNVHKGASIGGIYPGKDALTEELRVMDKTIALLTEGAEKKDLASATARLKSLTASLRAASGSGNASAIVSRLDDLTVSLDRRRNASGAYTDIASEIESLTKERAALFAMLGSPAQSIFAPVSGNYYSFCDGYEEYFTAEAARSLTLSSFRAMTADPGAHRSDYAGGKIVDSSLWYLALETTAENAVSFAQGSKYGVTLSSGESIQMTLETVSSDNLLGAALLVFSARVAPASPLERCENVTVVSSVCKGLIVPTAAMRYVEKDGVGTVGVYTIKGNKITFKKADILAEQNGYYVTAEYADKEHGEYLKLNDVIITSGKNIKEGYTE